MSATAAATYDEDRRREKLARLRGTGRRRQPPPQLRSPPPPRSPPPSKRTPPPPTEAPPAHWDDVKVGPSRTDDGDWDDVPVGGGRAAHDDAPARPRTPPADWQAQHIRGAPSAREWDEQPVGGGGARRAPPEVKQVSSVVVASQREWDEMPVGGGGQEWDEYPAGEGAPPSDEGTPRDAAPTSGRRDASIRAYDATPVGIASPATPAPPTPATPVVERPPVSIDELRDRWGTCVYLLRSPEIRDSEAMETTRRAAEDGVAYVEEVKRVALSLDIRGGALSKMLLPYGEETSTLEQAHTSNRAEYEQLEELGLPEQDARELVQKALAARSLVRVKVADDNDLEQMLLACGELRDFFGDLAAHARAGGMGAFEVFATLE